MVDFSPLFFWDFLSSFHPSEPLMKDSSAVITGRCIYFMIDKGPFRVLDRKFVCHAQKRKTVWTIVNNLHSQNTNRNYTFYISILHVEGKADSFTWLSPAWPASFCFLWKKQKYYPPADFDRAVSIIHRCAAFSSST